ncbi:cas scaffolding protein family member 4 [Dromiciops gliroides]|uniref:cas scaffolding protein family member 4 n=1 Tax=Dromiciops gliroides TaxID=33562 RepID=UPI001CC80D78|nr:cas scaffolding protein family member 4 [Dromiciops gliroides]
MTNLKGTSIMNRSPEQCILAKALYDNHAECADELAFRRGDILTILEKNVPESEGWWKCSLHGRQGLAPANRLHVLTDSQEDGLALSSQNSLEELPSSPEKTSHVPSELNRPPPPGVYEQMVGWVKLPQPVASPSIDQVYEQPAPLTTAKIFTEKTLSFAKQDLFTLPRPTSGSTINSQVYDVPSRQSQGRLIPKEQEKQVYDIPAFSEKAGIHVPKSHVYDVPPPNARVVSLGDMPCVVSPSTKSVRMCCYNTLPNPRKPGWIYDTPVSPDKAGLRQAPLSSSPEQKVLYDIPPPRCTSTLQNSPNDKSKTLKPQMNNQCRNVLLVQKKISAPEMPVYASPPPRDIPPLKPRIEYAVPPSFLIPRVEQQNTKPNIYDIPKGMSPVPQLGKDPENKNDASENCVYRVPPWLPIHPRSISPELSEQDRLSISSVDSRASISSCSSASTDPSSISSSEEPGKEVMLDLELAKEMVTNLQHRVASSIASLMIFVSSKWRFKEYLEANIDEIHRAAEHIKASLGEFLDFARLLGVNASNLTDSNLQVRIKKQLQIISDSYKILLETREALNNCNWSLDILVTDKLQNNPDDLDRFVMVARTIPEDIKRFVSIIIANGKLLFKQNCEKEETTQFHMNTEHKFATFTQVPRRKDVDLHQGNIALGKPREREFSSEPSSRNMRNVCDQDKSQKTVDLEDVEKTVFKQAEKKKDFKTKSLSPTNHKPLSRQDPEKKINLSEHCRLYFGGLLKAIGIFNTSLSNNQPPEIFITQSKLIIMIGQKLVDSLCQETKEKDVRNEILCSSSQLCGLLKNLAVATKNAVLKYPNDDAIRELQVEAEKLCKYTQQIRETLE